MARPETWTKKEILPLGVVRGLQVSRPPCERKKKGMTAQSKIVMQAATDRLNNVGPRGNCHWVGWEIRHPDGVVADCG